MKNNITESKFVGAFAQHDRTEDFSPEALRVLYDFLIEREHGSGREQELDVIALCCEWTEYTCKEYLDDYGVDGDDLGVDEIGEYVDLYKDDTVAEMVEAREADIFGKLAEYIGERATFVMVDKLNRKFLCSEH